MTKPFPEKFQKIRLLYLAQFITKHIIEAEVSDYEERESCCAANESGSRSALSGGYFLKDSDKQVGDDYRQEGQTAKRACRNNQNCEYGKNQVEVG